MLPANGSPCSMKRLISLPSSRTATRVTHGSTFAIISFAICAPTSRSTLEQNFLPPHPNTQQQSRGPGHGNERAAAVADPWQGDPGNRHQADRHPDVDDEVKSHHR